MRDNIARAVAASQIVKALTDQSKRIDDSAAVMVAGQRDDAAAQAATDAQIAQMTESIQAVSQAMASIQAAQAPLGYDVENLAAQVDQLAQSVQAAVTAAQAASSSAADLRDHVDGEVKAVEDRATALESEIAPIPARLDAGDDTDQRQDAAIAAIGPQLDDLRAADERLEGEIQGKASQADLAGKADAAALDGKADRADLLPLAPKASPAFSGKPTAPAPATGDNSSQIATTGFVQTSLSGKADRSALDLKADASALSGKADVAAVNLKADRTDLAPLAPKASPVFTGTPVAPTPAAADNSALIATTAFVHGELARLIGNATPTTLDTLQEIAQALGNDPDLATHVAAQIAAKQDRSAVLTILAGLAFVDGSIIYATGPASLAVAPSTAFGRSIIASVDAAGARTVIGAAAAADVTPLQRVRLATAADGTAAWVFPKPYAAGVVPVISCDVEAPVGTILPVYVQIDGPPTNIQAKIRAFRGKVVTISVLGVTVQAFESSGAVNVHLVAMAP